MVKINNKELGTLEKKLNKIAEDSGVSFSNLTPTETGYQMYAEVNPDARSSRLFFESPDTVKNLVVQRKVDPGSLIAKINADRETSVLQKQLYNAGLKDVQKAISSGENVEKTLKDVASFNKSIGTLNQRYRDILRQSSLDLRESSPETKKAIELYERSEDEYYKTGIYGTTLDLLSNFAATGFSNEIPNPDIKRYFDSWVNDTDFLTLVTKIFQNLFKYSAVYLLPALGNYEENLGGVSSIPGKPPVGGTSKAKILYAFGRFCKEQGVVLDRHKIAKAYSDLFKYESSAETVSTPLAYMILDPKTIDIESSGVFGGETLIIKSAGLEKIREALERADEGKLSKDEKEKLKLLPSKVKKAAIEGEDYVDLDGIVQSIYLRKNDFESYAKPRGSRAFDSFDYKEELKKADFATLDGIFNSILKVTVGDKDNPITDTSTLEALAEAFNTPQKAFAIVWNHTLEIEKISNNEIGEILGIKKYEPVNRDITAALGIARALIDGDNLSSSAGVLAAKSIQSEINAVREVVESWIYSQYKIVARVAGFDTYPVVRWKHTVITTDGDAVTRASWMQLADRMLVSRETAQLEMGLDPEAELEKLKKERDIRVNEGIGLLGSPAQQSPSSTTPDNTGTPNSEGRPKGQPTGEKKPIDETKTVTRKSNPPPTSQQPQQRAGFIEEVEEKLNSLSKEEKVKVLKMLAK